jgi:adenosylcobinamide-GDP ribazoletransferase
MVIAAVAFPLARPDGMAAFFRRGAGRRELVVGGLAVAATCALGGWAGLVSGLAGMLGGLALASVAARRLGGLTGDVYGATIEWGETLVLVVACLLHP